MSEELKEILKDFYGEMTAIMDKYLLKLLNEKFFSSEEKGSESKLNVKQESITKTRRKVVRISSKPCRYCNGLISWDDYETTGKPIHVDEDGYEVAGCKN